MARFELSSEQVLEQKAAFDILDMDWAMQHVAMGARTAMGRSPLRRCRSEVMACHGHVHEQEMNAKLGTPMTDQDRLLVSFGALGH